MNLIKKYLGVLWIAFGVMAGYYSINNLGLPKFLTGLSGNQSDFVFGVIMLFVLTPIIVGALLTFGYFALKGYYGEK